MRLSELQAYLAGHGQMLALDPPGDPTVGACLAADLSGPRRHRYRRDARSRDRRHRRPRGRARRELGREGGEERRRVRPRQALLRLPRPARPDRAASRSASIPARRRRPRSSPRAIRALPGRSFAARSSSRAPSTSCPAGSRSSSRGLPRRSTPRSPAAPASTPTTASGTSARLRSRVPPGASRSTGRTACSRGPGRASRSSPASSPRPWSPLAERVRASFDPDGILV